MNIYYDKDPLNDIDEAVLSPGYGEEFQSPCRSTVPSLSWLKHEQPMVSRLLNDLGMPADCNLHIEYEVKPLSGRPSYTDLMVLSGKESLAIEAKWTEPLGETVGAWLKKGENSQNYQDVLSRWLSLLQQQAKSRLNPDDFSDVVYQMLHRAASACESGGKPRLAYLLFKSSTVRPATNSQQVLEDLERLWKLLGSPDSFPFFLIELHLSPKKSFDDIAPLKKGQVETRERVKAALLGSEPLFTFEEPCVTRVK